MRLIMVRSIVTRIFEILQKKKIKVKGERENNDKLFNQVSIIGTGGGQRPSYQASAVWCIFVESIWMSESETAQQQQ